MHGITRNSDISKFMLSTPVSMLGEPVAPSKRLLDKRLVVCCNKQLLGTVRLRGWIALKRGGKHDAVGDVDEFVESARELQAKFVWFFDVPLQFKEPISHHGGIGVWKVGPDFEKRILAAEEEAASAAGHPSIPVEEQVDAVAREIVEQGELDFEPGEAVSPEGEIMDEDKLIPWKKKVFFPGDVCGVRDCTKTADGYMASIRKKRLWFGPICNGCARKLTTHAPQSLAAIAQQRKGLEDLASALDSPIENLQGLLEEHKIDAFGRPLSPTNGASHPSAAALSDAAHQSAAAPEIVPANDPAIERATAVTNVPGAELDRAKAEAVALFQKLAAFQIRDQDGMNLAVQMTQAVKAQHASLEAQRKHCLDPIDKTRKEVHKRFRATLEELEKVEDLLKKHILDAQRRFAAAQDAALQQVQQAYQQGNAHVAALATQHAQAAHMDLPQGASERTVLRFVVENLSLVPAEFFILDEARVLHALRAGLTIPGIRRVEEQTLAVRM